MTDCTRIISANDMHVLTTQFLSAAKEIHIAMCLFGDDHFAQKHLNSALQSALIGAQQCVKLHGSPKHRMGSPSSEDHPDA